MLRIIKQARAALSLLNPGEVKSRAERPVHVGLVAATPAGYEELENFLVPENAGPEARAWAADRVHRASDPNVPGRVDLVLYESGLRHGDGAYTLHRHDPTRTVQEILEKNEDLALA